MMINKMPEFCDTYLKRKNAALTKTFSVQIKRIQDTNFMQKTIKIKIIKHRAIIGSYKG
jgi:hypothetical protein